MKVSVIKVAPTAVIVVAAGFCAWPYIGTAESPAAAVPPPAPKGKFVIPLSLLNPTPPPRPERDPFVDAEKLRAEAREKVAQAIRSLIAARLAPKTLHSSSARRGAKPGAGGLSPGEADPRDGLVLGGTSVLDGRGMAVINGRSYTKGDRVEHAASPEPCVLADVHPHRVFLLYKGKQIPLEYRTPTTSASGPHAVSTASGAHSKPQTKPAGSKPSTPRRTSPARRATKTN
jgi:hypothetical protein